MLIRKASYRDVDLILKIYYNARIFMAVSGNKNQWINGYPDRKTVENDIESGDLYVVEYNGAVSAVFLFAEGIDKTYNQIDGNWLNNEPYSFIHRVASNGMIRGISEIIFNWCKQRCNSIKIDTHEDNIVMQKTVLNNGFKHCGTIITHNGTPRLAYQWVKN